jgi:drug/metabolite transporter (DMT)-like permease
MSAPVRPAAGEGAAQPAGMALVLLAAVLWSSSGLFVKLLTVPAFQLIAIRAGLAALTLLPFVRFRALRLDANLALVSVALGATQVFFVFATRWTTAANAIALQSTAPAWVFVGVWLATRRLQPPLLIPLGLIGAGIAAILVEPAHGTSLLGNLLGLGGGFCFALTQIAFKRINQPAVGTVAMANLASALAIALLVPGTLQVASIATWEWLSLVYLGAIQIGLAMLCFMAGVRRITVSQASILVQLEPLLNPLWVYLVLGELPSAYGFAGFALIGAGIAVDTWLRLWLPSLQRVPGCA